MAFWVELGESTSLLCDPGCNQTLALSAMNFSDPALGTSPVHRVGQGPFPRAVGRHRLSLRLCHCSKDVGHRVIFF